MAGLSIDSDDDDDDFVLQAANSQARKKRKKSQPPVRDQAQATMNNVAEGWTENLPDPQISDYAENCGPQCELPYDADVLKYFMKLCGDNFFDMLVLGTNANAAVKKPPAIPDPNDPFLTSDPHWEPVFVDEMKAFISINIMMGLDPKSEYIDYWSEDAALHNVYISSRMTRNRYEKLCQYFHCSDPRHADPNDKLDKVRPFLNVMEHNFPAMFTPGKKLSVDEAMIKFDGRLAWKQYMPKKPVKWGIKLWCLCDATTGYCLALSVYKGKDNNDEAKQLGLGYTVVMKLMENYLLRNHHVYADNFFSSYDLAKDLMDADTYYCGTVQINRKSLPQQIRKPKLQQYESIKWTAENSNIMVCRWKDKRDVYTISTNNNGLDTEKPRSRFKRDLITVPSVIVDYNKHMGGVDHFDQLRSYYDVGRTGRRWWKYLFWGFLNITIINAYILWYLSTLPHTNNKRSWSLKYFKLKLGHSLGDNFTSRKRHSLQGTDKTRKIRATIQREVIQGHSLVEFDSRKKICVVCKKSGKKTAGGNSIQTIFGCSGCSENMCKSCFRIHHNI